MTTEKNPSADGPDRLRARVEDVVASYGLALFDVQFRREATGWVLRVVIDRPWHPDQSPAETADEPVSIDECGRVSQDLSAILDVEPELVGGLDRAYTLEVSSPGLDRPLRGAEDYRRFTGRLAKIVTTEPVGGQSHFEGRIVGFEDGAVRIEQGRRTHVVPVKVIKRGRLDIEF